MDAERPTDDETEQREAEEPTARRERDRDLRPEPGVTAPLDEFTEAEQRMEPVGVMPGAGPDVGPDDSAPPAPGSDREADRAKANRSAIDDDVARGEPGEDAETED